MVVEISPGGGNPVFPAKHSIDKFLGGGFPITACDSQYGYVVFAPVHERQLLKRSKYIVDKQRFFALKAGIVNHSIGGSFFYCVFRVHISIKIFTFQGKKQASIGYLPGVGRNGPICKKYVVKFIEGCTHKAFRVLNMQST
jgi:hypothetical protein